MLPPVEMPATSTGPPPNERIASACSSASSAIDIPRGSPLLRLTNITCRRSANGFGRPKALCRAAIPAFFQRLSVLSRP